MNFPEDYFASMGIGALPQTPIASCDGRHVTAETDINSPL